MLIFRLMYVNCWLVDLFICLYGQYFFQAFSDELCRITNGKCVIDNAPYCHKKMVDILRTRMVNRQKASAVVRRISREKMTRLYQTNSQNQTVSVNWRCGRMGNWMFQMASLLAVARKNRRIPLPFTDHKYYRLFGDLGFTASEFVAANDVENSRTKIQGLLIPL